MPDLAEKRMEFEKLFLSRSEATAKDRREELLAILSSGVDPPNIPEEVWQRYEREDRDDQFWILLLIFLFAYNNLHHELGSPALDGDGNAVPDPTSGELPGETPPVPIFPPVQPIEPSPNVSDLDQRPGRGNIELPPATPNQMRQGVKWADDVSGWLSRSFNRTTRERLNRVADQSRETSKSPDWNKEVGEVLGKRRLERMVATETTRAISAGELALVGRLETSLGWVIKKIWFTERDEDVCTLCEPLDKTDEDFFMDRVGPPPAHIDCRCWLTYKVISRGNSGSQAA